VSAALAGDVGTFFAVAPRTVRALAFAATTCVPAVVMGETAGDIAIMIVDVGDREERRSGGWGFRSLVRYSAALPKCSLQIGGGLF
jgi:hypothetical protein